MSQRSGHLVPNGRGSRAKTRPLAQSLVCSSTFNFRAGLVSAKSEKLVMRIKASDKRSLFSTSATALRKATSPKLKGGPPSRPSLVPGDNDLVSPHRAVRAGRIREHTTRFSLQEPNDKAAEQETTNLRSGARHQRGIFKTERRAARHPGFVSLRNSDVHGRPKRQLTRRRPRAPYVRTP